MLFRKNRCRHEHGDLFVPEDGKKCGTNGNFCLSETHITANEAIHGCGAFHIKTDLFPGSRLIGSFLVEKRFLHGPEQLLVRLELMAGKRFPLGIQTQKVFRHALDGFLRLRLQLVPR